MRPAGKTEAPKVIKWQSLQSQIVSRAGQNDDEEYARSLGSRIVFIENQTSRVSLLCQLQAHLSGVGVVMESETRSKVQQGIQKLKNVQKSIDKDPRCLVDDETYPGGEIRAIIEDVKQAQVQKWGDKVRPSDMVLSLCAVLRSDPE